MSSIVKPPPNIPNDDSNKIPANLSKLADTEELKSDANSESDTTSDPDEIYPWFPTKRWIDQKKYIIECRTRHGTSTLEENYDDSNKIDGTFARLNEIDGLKTTLFPHQKPIVQAMIDAENNRRNELIIIPEHNACEQRTTTLLNSACVLSEPVGSGKTIDVLALIMSQKFPKAIQDIGIMTMCDELGTPKPTIVSVVRKKFKHILHPTIVFVGVSVIDQWITAIKTFTNLRYYAVYQVKDLQMLVDMMTSKKINNYDIVIVKNGKVTRPITFPKFLRIEWKNKKQISYIYNIISNIRNYCWARVVVDDFDTIKLPHNAGLVNGLFTWYISSTQKTMHVRITKNTQFRKTSDMLLYSNFGCGKIMENHILFQCLNIRNNPSFIKHTNRLPAPKFYTYVFKNPNDRYIGLMGSMDNEQASQIMEMLNGDAFETAAEAAGVKSTSVADIFQKILGTQFENYEHSTRILAFIDKNEDATQRRPFSANTDPDDTYTKKNLLEFRRPEYNYPNLRSLLVSTKEEYKEINEKSGMAIQRVKSNISEGNCPICYIEFADGEEDTVILKCCGVVVCSACCFETIFPKKSMRGQCSNCRHRLTMLEIIYMNSEFDLESITKDRIKDDFSNGTEEVKALYKKPRSKIDAIIDIINGVVPEERKEVDIRIHNLMKGLGTLEDGTIQKVLIFANFDETLIQIEKDLKNRNINFTRLGGGHSEITKIATEFNTSTISCVMTINSTKHCSGLNLQTATDLIFAHKIIDKNIQSQVAGRIQRMGRSTQARIHFMLYTNEFDWMTLNNELRII